MSTALTPDDVLASLKAECTSTRAHRNLDVLHTVCRKAKESDRDFSLATIGRASEKAGGPSLNTLYSPLGARFKKLVMAWSATESGARENVVRSEEPRIGSDQEILDKIEDPVTRSLVGFKLAELRRVRQELNVLKSATKLTVDLRPKTASDVVQVITPRETLLPSEREALEQITSPKWLKRQGWREGERGDVLAGEKEILPVGSLTAIRKTLQA